MFSPAAEEFVCLLQTPSKDLFHSHHFSVTSLRRWRWEVFVFWRRGQSCGWVFVPARLVWGGLGSGCLCPSVPQWRLSECLMERLWWILCCQKRNWFRNYTDARYLAIYKVAIIATWITSILVPTVLKTHACTLSRFLNDHLIERGWVAVIIMCILRFK